MDYRDGANAVVTHFSDLARILQSESCAANFTIAGQIPVLTDAAHDAAGNLTPGTASQVNGQTVYPKPVTVRWGPDGAGCTITFPIFDREAQEHLETLVQACAPATFGRGGEDVYDTGYRKAGALTPGSDFVTDFSPYETGIMDLVVQCLVPALAGELDPRTFDKGQPRPREQVLSRGLRAELYKLNVYSGPSGRFRPHVDTPRSEWQIGSLVVALPVTFEGGDLTVSHGRHTVSHACSTSSTTSINWAAFYSDCTHEVLPVTAGYRLTLTYNLYLSKGHGLLCTRPSILLPTQLPLAGSLRSSLADKNFMANGGYLGFHLTHGYPHTHNRLYRFVPYMLKGIDMVLHTAVTQGLGHIGNLSCVLVPINADTGSVPASVFDALDEIREKTGHHDGDQLPPSLLESCEIDYEERDECEVYHEKSDDDMSVGGEPKHIF